MWRRRPRVTLCGGAVSPWILLFLLVLPNGGVGQEAPSGPALFEGACPVEPSLPAPPSATARSQAERLLDESSRAQLLGNQEEARSLLRAAAVLDPTSVEVGYRLARSEEDLGDLEQARVNHCRVLGLLSASGGSPEVERGEVEMALAQVLNTLRSMPGGMPAADRGRTSAMERVPSPAAAERTVRPPTTPVSAFLLGLLPGMGHFQTGRPGVGWTVVGVVGGALGFGALAADREPVCMVALGESGTCPPTQVRTRTSRPHLTTAVGVAGVVTLISALDAARGARSRGALARIGGGEGSSTPTLQWMPVQGLHASSPTDLTWLRLQFLR
jgi:hypothetical protein